MDTQKQSSTSFDHIVNLLGQSKSLSNTSRIPQSVLAMAPHLANLQSKVSADPYIAKTWVLCQEYSKEKVIDSLIILGQLQQLKDPISCAMWKLVMLDQFVDFDKLYVMLDRGYGHYDKPKDFSGGFSSVKKDVTTVKRPVKSELDWTRVFDAWMAAVILFYPHHENELFAYRTRILDFCQNIPNDTAIAI
ncbi:hypothetical protein C0989_001386 [Termitomyces sp. Mn162]|nr:hypothetical protein C0989_001386 [Termitomyces sp. Mn162]